MEQIFNYEVLICNGFELNEDNHSEYFGDYYHIYSNAIINVRFISDKSKISIDINSQLDTDNWFDLILIKALINNESNLLEHMDVNQYNNFLKNNLTLICELFNKQNYFSTKKRLEILENKRVKQMFSNIKKYE